MKTKQSRRDFLRISSAGAIGALLLSKSDLISASEGDRKKKATGVGLQLYTIRDAMGKDVQGSLKKVSDIGYKYLELASYREGKFYGQTPEDLKKMANDLGMEIISSHAGINPKGISDDDAKKMAEDHAKVGAKYCMQPFIGDADRKSAEGYRKMVADWNKVGKIMKDNGVKFGYHNHNFEFDTVDGKVPYFDIMLAEMDKDLLTMELDLFWAAKAGLDPVELFNKYPGRFELFHVKDMSKKEEPFFKTASDDMVPVGTGVIDFKRILDAGKKAGLKYMFVEQDNAGKGDAFAAIQTSFTNLTTKILG